MRADASRCRKQRFAGWKEKPFAPRARRKEMELKINCRHAAGVDFQRHLLVDGSNLVHAWPELRGLAKRDRDSARAQLVRRLAAIHDVERIRVTIVFDGRGDDLVVERPSAQPTFSVVFTPSSLSADDVIEQMVANAVSAGDCLVATDDRAERETISAAGAVAISADDLASWTTRVEARQASSLAALRAENARKWKRP